MLDCHAHTNLSYCAEASLTPAFYAQILRQRRPALEKIAITNHGMAIYFPGEIAWKWEFMSDPSIFDKHRDWGNERLERHLGEMEAFAKDGLLTGIEVEMMSDQRLTLDPAFRKRLNVIIGSVHYLPVSKAAGTPHNEIISHWEHHTEQLLATGIDILGHPFRWLSTQVDSIPENLVRRTVESAHRAGIALELNSHFKISTDAVMLRAAAELGAELAFGSDSHLPAECGDLSYHTETVEAAGLKLSDLRLFNAPRH